MFMSLRRISIGNPFATVGLGVSWTTSPCFLGANPEHILSKQRFFFLPGPPNFGMSRHVLHLPQFGFAHPAHWQVVPGFPVTKLHYNNSCCSSLRFHTGFFPLGGGGGGGGIMKPYLHFVLKLLSLLPVSLSPLILVGTGQGCWGPV